VLYLIVEKSYNPDKTRLLLEFAKKQTIKTKEPKRSRKGAKKELIKGRWIVIKNKRCTDTSYKFAE